MTVELNTRPRKLALASVVALATVGLWFPLSAHYWAAHHSAVGSQEALEKALTFQPGNAEMHNQLGKLLLYSQSPQRALLELERATQLDPQGGRFWADLALARESNGNLPAASAALARARAVEPRTPAILWLEANYLIRRKQDAQALERLKLLLADSPEYTVRALAFFSPVVDPGVLIEQVVPPRRDALEGAMEFVRREEFLSSAPKLWKAAAGLQEGLSVFQLRHFVDWLLRARQVDLAKEVWSESGRRGWLPVDPAEDAKPFYNGGFEKPLQNFGFDWRALPHPDASVWIEGRGPAPGLQSLCIQFAQEAREDYRHLTHAVAVEPNTHYELQAALRSDRLISRAGAFLSVITNDQKVLAKTVAVTGTSHWKEVAVNWVTGPETNLVFLLLSRPGVALKTEPASGMACVADVRWSKLGPAIEAERALQ